MARLRHARGLLEAPRGAGEAEDPRDDGHQRRRLPLVHARGDGDARRRLARRLAQGRGLSDEAAHALAREGKAIVHLDGGLHSTEVAGAQHTILLAYKLVSTQGDPQVDAVLNNVILMLWPTLNPDGTYSVAVSVFSIATSCSVDGIAVVDGAGHVSVYGAEYGLPDLGITLTRVPDTTPPVATGAALSATTITPTENHLHE